MSYSRFFRALMSTFACLAVFATAASAAITGPTGATSTADSAETVGPIPDPIGSADSTRSVRPGPVVLKIADYTVNYGGKFRLRGRTGNPFKGRVRVQSDSSGRWRTVRKVRTDRKGRFRAKIPARVNSRLRVKTGDGRRSKVRRVTVIGRLKLARPARYVRLGDSLVIRGTVLPRGVRKVRMRVRRGGVVTTRSRANGRFRLRWRPRAHGDFGYRVRALPSRRSTGDPSRRRKFSALRPGHASYYGPGLYGNGVACGGTLTPNTRGVANKSLPCGTKVTLQYGNRTVVARVIDRGPYVAGRDWDLTEQTKRDLGFGGVGVVWTNK